MNGTMALRTDDGSWTRSVAGEFPIDWDTYEPAWVRTYPADMRMEADDHLAVGSGAYARWLEHDWTFWKNEAGCWVEDLSGVAFDDVDVAYLDWLCGNRGWVTSRIQAYRVGAGRARFRDEVLAAAADRREPGWMYATLGTFLYYQDRRDSMSVLSESGCWGNTPWEDGTDDGRTAGRVWDSEAFDWAGPVRRGYWTDLIQAASDLREMYTRIVEMGPACSPDGDLSPAAWARREVDRIITALPAVGGRKVRLISVRMGKWVVYVETDGRDTAAEKWFDLVRKTGQACLDAVEQIDTPVDTTDLVTVLFHAWVIMAQRPVIDDGPSDRHTLTEDDVEVFRVSADCAICQVAE